MTQKVLFIISTILFAYVYLQEEASVLCTLDFCSNYIVKGQCKGILPAACNKQNKTEYGLFLPSPGPCNCCKYCLEKLSTNASCPLGDPSSSVPSKICGGRLSCHPATSTCQAMNTTCVNDQKKYDDDRIEGCLGHLQIRPECDDDGTYKPYRIIPGEIVYCVSEDGERIFGEVPASKFNSSEFDCKCSRNFYKTKKRLNATIHMEHFRCKSDGDYDALQCIGQYCLCAKEVDGAPINDTQMLVKMDQISNTTLECFDFETHLEGEYYRECEMKFRELFAIFKEQMLNGSEVLEYHLPKCQLDGNYAPVQENATHKYCVDPHGGVLENFAIQKTKSLGSMDCKCARARSIITDIEKPTCDDNGNYSKLQCRRGMCYCVDDNGLQIRVEVDYEDRKKLCCEGNDGVDEQICLIDPCIVKPM